MTIAELRNAAAAALQPPPDITIAEWAEQNLVLSSESTARPGLVILDPFQREPLECLSPNHPAKRVVMMCGSQLMKTFCIQAATAYAIAVAPGPILIGEPREKDVRGFTQDRLDPMLRDTPALAGLVASKKSRDSANTQDFKKFKGGSITICGAQSPENFAMRAIRYLFLDEPDRYPISAGKEGNPIYLARQRQTTYPGNRKELLCGTPTVEGRSVTADEYALSDQREWFVPCPECGHEQTLRWAQVRWGSFFGLEIAPADAHYECESCKELIPHWKKAAMNAKGRWVPTNPVGAFPGFHASQLISPRKTWGDLAVEFLQAKDKPESLIVFTNTCLAEVWRERGDAPDWEKLLGRTEEYYLATVPQGVLFLTAGIDVQADRLEMQVIGWARGKERWLVDYVVIDGDTRHADVWTRLSEAIEVSYETQSGVSLPINKVMIDSGYATTEVYEWARRQAPGRVLIGKGVAHGPALLGAPAAAEVDTRGKKRKFGVKIWPVNVSMAKDELYGHLRLPRPEPGVPKAGYFHIPRLGWTADRSLQEYLQQLTAEEFVVRVVKGYKRGEWVKARARNEALDTANLARAAAEYFGVSRLRDQDWDAISAHLGIPLPVVAKPAQTESEPEPQAPFQPAAAAAGQQASSYFDRGRGFLRARGGWLR